MTSSPSAFTTLIAPATLALHLDDPHWVILDCRHDLADPQAGRSGYLAGHVPGARFVSIDDDLSDKSPAADGSFRGRHPLPSRAAFIDTLRRLGIDDTTQVIACDAQGGMFAARLWWMLRWVGHARVAVLDGGMAAWLAEGHPVSTGAETTTKAGNIDERDPLVEMVSAADVERSIAQGQRIVIDARAPDRFRGENETLDPVGGHIPGAKNRFFKDNLQGDGRFRPPAELRAAFEALVAEPAAAIMQCGSGVTACHNLLAMEVAGLSGAALYPGSWSEWCADPARPVATGTA
jgi:thiosulfate/3-mercaptopyruvate sulfurtransferase